MSRGLNLLSLQSKLKFAVEARAAPCCTHTVPDLIPGLLSPFLILLQQRQVVRRLLFISMSQDKSRKVRTKCEHVELKCKHSSVQ